ncbi:Retrovirus-related Pol polyprotein from transposon TNT 1-94 [Araneus ventricosus]|uniref:Retrovirus-related Pol polyprotein from transposon TNT 1-94 n=1 Tax=Araneus ventricosus TaxID=182803 RepID=A0A4Y2R6G1_ARAVE|nr:Retrovirus-related Pol polyprotein from transposon TNT 1-94 [Araneus ventricosus]
MAYVNGDLNEEIFMEQADHFIDQKHPGYVYKLQLSLYGLKQAGRQWFCKLDGKLKSFVLNPLSSDKCVYKLKNPKGIEFSQNVKNGQITMPQCKYIENVLEKFNMQDAKTVKTPLDPNVKLTKEMCPKTEAEKAELSLYPYQSLIGSFMYLAVCARSDICDTVSYISQFNENPDTDWSSDITGRKSYSYCVLKFADGDISWESKKQHCVALSSTKAEYIALSECAKEIVYLRRFLNELFDSADETPTVVLSDSQAAQKLVQNPIFHSCTKHFDIRCHYIHEVYERGEIMINYVPTDQMV